MLCNNCLHFDFIKTEASTYCLCSKAFSYKEELRHNPDAKCNYFKDKAFFNPPLIDNCIEQKDNLVYPMFSMAKNVKDGKDFSEYYLSCNYGTVNPFSLGLWGRGTDGWYRIDEFYYSARDNGIQLTDEEYYEKLKELCGNRKITALVINPSAASFIETVLKHNEIPVIKANNFIRKGVKRVGVELALHELFISPKCVNSIREFLTYSWNDENHLPEKKNDRTMDDIRFFVSTIVANHKSL